MKVLIVGGGGREHTIAWKLAQSPLVDELYAAPGNGGIAKIAKCVPISATDIDGIVKFATENSIDLTFVAPDDPLVLGMVDALEAKGLKAFGPRKNAAIIEGSKVFSKELMKKYKIPTAEYEVFTNSTEAIEYIKDKTCPIVIKAEGLALGKGVIIAQTHDEAKKAICDMMDNKQFGDAGNRIVIEEFLSGPEISVLAFTDGKTIKPMVSAQDHKRAYDGDKGLNTGGMGTFSPSRIYTPELADICMNEVFVPTMEAMNKEGRTFKGVLYFGLMLTQNGIRVIEYNCRFGDPETQVVLPRLKTDFAKILLAIVDEKLDEIDIEWYDNAAVCVVMASGGYPQKYEKGYKITGIDEACKEDNITVFHAGTKIDDAGDFITSGGRVIGVTAASDNLDAAIKDAYNAVAKINFKDAHYRKDIGIK